MIGKMKIIEPEWRSDIKDKCEDQRSRTGQDYQSIFLFGLSGTNEHTPEIRLYAGYRCVEKTPDEGSYWLEIARIHAEAGQFTVAENVLDELDRLGGLGLFRQVYGEDTGVHRALLYASAGNFSDALKCLRGISDRLEGHPLYPYTTASLLHAMERWEEAVVEYGNALKLLNELTFDDVGDDVDLPSAVDYVRKRLDEAAKKKNFQGIRPLDLGQLYEL